MTVAAAVSVAVQPSEQAVLERLVQVARDLTGAGHAAALLVGPDGHTAALAEAGTSAVQLAVLPRPTGLVSQVVGGATLRLADPAARLDPVGHGGEAPTPALLGVPVTAGAVVLGGLYLTRPPDAGTFSEADELAVTALAEQAGTAVRALRREQASAALVERIGAPWPRADDGPATEPMSPVVRRLLAAARDVLGSDLTFLSRLDEGTQHFTHVDHGPGAPPLVEGSTIDEAGGYCTLLLDGQNPRAVPDVPAHPVLGALPVTASLGVGSYCGVPVRLPDGTVHGTLCGLSSSTGHSPTGAQLEALRTIAALIGATLAQQQRLDAERTVQAAAFTTMLDDEHREIHLQPIVDLRSRRPVGFEALSRFTDLRGAARRPDEVFAHAARIGVGPALEQTAARAALRWLPDLPDGTYLSVNLSPQALLAPATVDLLTDAVGDLPDRVVVELTEHDRVDDYPALLAVLRGLRRRGLRLAIDDTGAGFASLQHVTRMQPDILKLDIAFVHDVHRDPSRRAVARALTAFAADIGADLVAEGIETAGELDELVRLGAPLGQGFLLGRPAPALGVLSPSAGATTSAPT